MNTEFRLFFFPDFDGSIGVYFDCILLLNVISACSSLWRLPIQVLQIVALKGTPQPSMVFRLEF